MNETIPYIFPMITEPPINMIISDKILEFRKKKKTPVFIKFPRKVGWQDITGNNMKMVGGGMKWREDFVTEIQWSQNTPTVLLRF